MCARCTGGTRLSRPSPHRPALEHGRDALVASVPLRPRWSTGGTRLSRPSVPPSALEHGRDALVASARPPGPRWSAALPCLF